jgi:hypothetical protein
LPGLRVVRRLAVLGWIHAGAAAWLVWLLRMCFKGRSDSDSEGPTSVLMNFPSLPLSFCFLRGGDIMIRSIGY